MPVFGNSAPVGILSFALAQTVLALGFLSSALKQMTFALGILPFAPGQKTFALGFFSFALGQMTAALGNIAPFLGKIASNLGNVVSNPRFTIRGICRIMVVMKIPFVDLKEQYLSLKNEFDAAVALVVSETAFIGGRYAAAFERAFADYLGVGHCVAVANGTDAIEIALQAVGMEPGDEVLVPANTFIATAEGVSNIGALPVFVDADPVAYNIDPAKIEEKITPRTKAIIAVHLYGLPADMDAIMWIASKHGLNVVEDTAQAHGATYKGRRVGSFGDAATFSFYPSKNLGAFGDAGAIVTNNAATAESARLIANHGQAAKNSHTIVGRNSRMDGIQAAVLSVKLPHLDGWLEARRANAKIYNELLRDSGLTLPVESEHSRHTYHLYVVQVSDRDSVQSKMAEVGIETGVHYPTALPFMEAYQHLGHTPDEFPVAHSQMDKLLSLPMYAELTAEQIEYVCSTLKNTISLSAAATE